MRTTEEYAAMIPAAPPFDLVGYLRERGKMGTEIISYKWLGRDDTDSWLDCEDCQDMRPSAATKSALLWCSACGEHFLAEYLPRENAAACHAGSCTGYSGVQIADMEVMENITYREYDKLCCPLCGAETVLYRTNSLRYGRGNQEFVVVPTVAGNCLVLTQWCIERWIYNGHAAMRETAVNAYIADGGKIIKLAHYQHNAMSRTWANLGEWKRRAKVADDILAPLMYGRDLPDLAGTCVENAKLWEYMEQAEAGETASPVAYLRLYFKHPAVENLITAGLGKLVGTGIRDYHRRMYGYGYSSGASMTAAPKLDWVNWKEKRPAQMIGLDKQQLKTWQQMGFGLDCLKVWKKHKLANDISFADCCTLMAVVGPTSADEILMAGVPPIRTANYLKRQNQAWNYLEDYWRMARLAGYDPDQDAVRWPKVLQRAHDRAAAAVKYQNINSQTKEAFTKMTARCQGLAWEHDGICIRPAANPQELIEEGNTLRHCVGGYSESHAKGKIILFVRHTRRPDRSWYTLNINVLTKEEIQLHGYRNELVDGKRMKIPRRVREFVDLWEREVLAKWQLPPEKTAPKKKSRFAAAESVA